VTLSYNLGHSLGVQVPSNIILKRLRPSIWLSSLMIVWGVAMTMQGIVHNYSGLLGKTTAAPPILRDTKII
jgi:hypothetical protein